MRLTELSYIISSRIFTAQDLASIVSWDFVVYTMTYTETAAFIINKTYTIIGKIISDVKTQSLLCYGFKQYLWITLILLHYMSCR